MWNEESGNLSVLAKSELVTFDYNSTGQIRSLNFYFFIKSFN